MLNRDGGALLLPSKFTVYVLFTLLRVYSTVSTFFQCTVKSVRDAALRHHTKVEKRFVI